MMNSSINKIWIEYQEPLKRFIKKRVENEQDAQDVLQDVFLKVQSKLKSLTDDNKLESWLYEIARNTIIDYYRKSSKNDRLTILDECLECPVKDEKYANIEIASCLKSMINELPDIYKQAIIMTQFQHVTQKELSQRLGISLSGAKSRVQRGKKLLKGMLSDCCTLELDRRGNVIDYKCKMNTNKYC